MPLTPALSVFIDWRIPKLSCYRSSWPKACEGSWPADRTSCDIAGECTWGCKKDLPTKSTRQFDAAWKISRRRIASVVVLGWCGGGAGRGRAQVELATMTSRPAAPWSSRSFSAPCKNEPPCHEHWRAKLASTPEEETGIEGGQTSPLTLYTQNLGDRSLGVNGQDPTRLLCHSG